MNASHAKAATKALDAIGSTTEVAELLGVKPNVVTNWKARGVPAKWAPRVAKMARMSLAELRPDMVTA